MGMSIPGVQGAGRILMKKPEFLCSSSSDPWYIKSLEVISNLLESRLKGGLMSAIM